MKSIKEGVSYQILLSNDWSLVLLLNDTVEAIDNEQQFQIK